jgi:ubiquinone/menaquinone biosynthesis C-methylase UbiE
MTDMPSQEPQHPPICDYEGSDYQTSFWEQGGRAYEDGAEVVALKRMLPSSGKLMLEVGAGAGRNTPRYKGYERIVVMDYSVTQLQQAQAALGRDESKYIYVAADVYRLPFAAGLFDGATMIRVLHHMAEPQQALAQVRESLQPGATFILEFANKQNLKAILRYWLGKQSWSPFTLEPVEIIELNYDFHPKAVKQWLAEVQFKTERILTVSHFRVGFLKRWVPTRLLVWLDSLAALTGGLWQLSPSVFVKNQAVGDTPMAETGAFFRCPECKQPLGGPVEDVFSCECGLRWGIEDGIYNFKQPLE